MPQALARIAMAALLALAAAWGNAQSNWGDIAVISSTLGNHANRLCVGEGLRVTDIGCPTYAPYVRPSDGNVGIGTTNPNAAIDVHGTVSATNFVGNGSGLTGISLQGDRIISGTLAMVANSNTGIVSLSTNGTVWGYLGNAVSYLPTIVADRVSASDVSVTRQLNIGVLSPNASAALHVSASHTTGSYIYLTTNAPNANNGLFLGQGYPSSPNWAGVGQTSQAPGALRLVGGNTFNSPDGITVADNGWVGIGTYSPSATLHVAGTISASSAVQVGSAASLACATTISGSIRYSQVSSTMEYCNGIAWTELGIGGVSGSVAFSVIKTADQSGINANDVVTWDSAITNNGGAFNLSIERFVAPVKGYYFVVFTGVNNNDTTNANFLIYKNGSSTGLRGYGGVGSETYKNTTAQGVLYLSAGDYVDVRSGSASQTLYGNSNAVTTFSGFLLGSGASGGGNGANALSELADVSLGSLSSGQVLTYNGSSWVNIAGVTGDRITSGTVSVTVNTNGYVSLTTGITDWGYLSSAVSFLPTLSANRVSATNVSVTYVQLNSPTMVLACNSGFAGAMRYTSGTMQVCDGTSWGNIGIGVPTGTIAAFAASSCPSGWSEYTPARGRFLRGIDTLAAGVDPAGTRSPGAAQDDAFQGHYHSFTDDSNGSNAYVWDGAGSGGILNGAGQRNFGLGLVTAPITDGTNGTPRTAAETRPKNVAVTFCVYAGYQSAPGQTMLTTLASLTDVSVGGVTTGQVLAFNGSAWVPSNSAAASTAQGDRITSGTHSVSVNTNGYVSLTTGVTDWGYLSSLASYLPNLRAGNISASNVIQVGSNSLACSNGISGSIRYSQVSSTMEYCNSTAWVSMGPSATVVPSFRINQTSDQSIGASGSTKLNFHAKQFDSNVNFDLSTDRFTPTVPGTYILTAGGALRSLTSGRAVQAAIYKNGAVLAYGTYVVGSGSSNYSQVSTVVTANGTTDYFEVYIYNSDTSARDTVGDAQTTYFSGSLISMAGGGGGGGVADNLGDHIATQNLAMGAYNIIGTGQVSLTNVSATYLQLNSPSTVLACWSGMAGAMRYTSGTMQVCDGTSWSNIGLGVPTGTIAAFQSTSCPSGWSEYTASRGRFLRGYDNSAGVDPDGNRTPGTAQGDAAPNITGSFTGVRGFFSVGSGAFTTSNQAATAPNAGSVQRADTVTFDASTSNAKYGASDEIRPKNVAVIFCSYAGFQSAPGQTILTTLASLTDVAASGATIGQVLAYNGTNWVASNTTAASTAQGDRITSGTHTVAVNTATGVVSLSTSGTSWGYLANGSSFLPILRTATISASSAIQVGTNSLTCSSGISGTIRYSTISNTMEYCNSTAWVSMGPSDTTPVSFRVTKGGTNQTVVDGATTLMTWSTEAFDTNNNFASNRFTPTVPGKYLVNGSMLCSGTTPTCATLVYKNGSIVAQNGGQYSSSGGFGHVTTIVSMNGTTDYLELYGYNNGGTVISGNVAYTYFEGVLLSPQGGIGGGSDNLGDHTATQNLAMGAYSIVGTGQVSMTNVSATYLQLNSATTVLACGSGMTGAMRYTSGTMQVCDGTNWGNIGIGVPTGTITAFQSTSCPSGWTEYTASRGRFLRGYDNGAGNDPDGNRTPGTTQVDELKAHTHNHSGWNGGIAGGGTGGLASGASVNYTSNDKITTSSGGTETRPKNVTVIFCQYSGYQSSPGQTILTTLASLTDVAVSGATIGQVLAYNGTTWVASNTAAASTAQGDRITSGTHTVSVNTGTGYVSLSTSGTDWGYFSSGISYLPTLMATRTSSTNVSATYLQLNSASTVMACNSGFTGAMRYTSGTMQVCDGANWGNIGIGVPTGTIAAFESASCPAGWSAYTPAYGRFLRGIDPAGTNDTANRTPGNLQADELKSHTHTGPVPEIQPWRGTAGSNIYGGTPRQNIADTGATGGSETRPKNVAVTFCQYNGFATVLNGTDGITWDNTNKRLGIGTAAPSVPLHITGATPLIYLQDNGATGATADGYLAFYDSAGTRTGFVGDGSGINSDIYILSDNGSVKAGAGVNQCTYTSGASWSCSSDARMKDRITALEDSLEKVVQLRGVSYHWRDQAKAKEMHLGLIAQEVQKVFPEAVSKNADDGMLQLDYSSLISPLIEAVKELKHLIDGVITEVREFAGKLAGVEREQAALRDELNKVKAENARLRSELLERLEMLESKAANDNHAKAATRKAAGI